MGITRIIENEKKSQLTWIGELNVYCGEQLWFRIKFLVARWTLIV